MKGIANILRATPLSVVAFGVLHLLIGLAVLTLLVASHCVDQPCPPDVYCFGGCSQFHDPWRDGDWPYLLAISIGLVAASILILRAQRSGRWLLLLAIAGVIAYVVGFEVVTIEQNLERDFTEERKREWGAAWEQLLAHTPPLYWLVLLGWLAFDAWFLMWRRREYFCKVLGKQGV